MPAAAGILSLMAHFGIDCRFAATGTGLARYTRETVKNLLLLNSGHDFTLFTLKNNEDWLKELAGSFTVSATNIKHYSLKEQLFLPLVLEQSHIDLFYSPHFNVPWRCRLPFIVTVHDLILHRFPNKAGFIKQWAYRNVFLHAINEARSIIAVSDFTAEELDQYFNLKKPVHVVSEAVSPQIRPQPADVTTNTLNKFGVKKPYFLYVGNAKEHKNVQFLIDSFNDAKITETTLILVTGGKEANHLNFDQRIKVITKVTDQELSALYGAALSFVTASLYEGFCLPIAEARACGCPVIACDIGAVREISGENDLLIKSNKDEFIKAFRCPPPASSPPRSITWRQIASEILQILLSS